MEYIMCYLKTMTATSLMFLSSYGSQNRHQFVIDVPETDIWHVNNSDVSQEHDYGLCFGPICLKSFQKDIWSKEVSRNLPKNKATFKLTRANTREWLDRYLQLYLSQDYWKQIQSYMSTFKICLHISVFGIY